MCDSKNYELSASDSARAWPWDDLRKIGWDGNSGGGGEEHSSHVPIGDVRMKNWMESSEKMEEHSSQFSLGFCGVGVAEMRCPDKISQFERLWCLQSRPHVYVSSAHHRLLFFGWKRPFHLSCCGRGGRRCLLFHRDIFSGKNSKLELRVDNMDKTYKHMRCFLSCQPHH